MSSPAEHRVAGAPAPLPIFPDEILEEIFVRLDAAEDVARASAACTAFHRVVSARRFRCLHPTPALGLLELGRRGAFHPAEPPHCSAPAARALVRAADLTFSLLGVFSFLDYGNGWGVCDASDSRVLFYWQHKDSHLTVCDPLHRRQIRLPPLPYPYNLRRGFSSYEFDSFLDPTTYTEKEKQEDLSFRVVCAALNRHKIVTFHFSSVTGKWRAITFNIPVPLSPDFNFRVFRRYYAHGCFFWRIGDSLSFMVMLNMHDMKLSVVDLPAGTHENPQQAIVEAGEGMIGLLNLSDGMLQLYYKSLHGTDWRHERIISLPKLKSCWRIHNAAAGYLLLEAKPRRSSLFAKQLSQYFTLSLKTFLVERLCIPNQYIEAAYLYASVLLPFSKPSI